MCRKVFSVLLFGALSVFAWGLVQDKAESAKDLAVKRMAGRVTLEQRKAAAAVRLQSAGVVRPASPPMPGGEPNYFGPEPNWGLSPRLKKFVDSLPLVNAPNNLGQMLTVAVPDTVTFPGSDYYEIAVMEFKEKMHSELEPTRLRGYVQLNKGTDASGKNSVDPAPIHYLGPLIVAQKDRPVRIKFTNLLPSDSGGDLFIPTDTSVMGAGMGRFGSMYSQNRATLHLHGGRTPWISDGTPHQWITPAGESTIYAKGESVRYVPDMFFDASGKPVPAGTPGATNDPGPGSMTFYYTNQQSARLMFYHDHSYGITRLNVYAGEAAGYLVTDPAEQILIQGGLLGGLTVKAGTIPAEQIPLIIQDKSFVDPDTIGKLDPTWNGGGDGQLWFPHVYMTNQNPANPMGVNDLGRWDYGPWFWPPVTGIANPPVVKSDGTAIPGTPNPSIVPEAFMDTPMVNGTAYPYLTVQRKAYRFRILNACNDRFLNLQLYYADPSYTRSFRGGTPGLPAQGTEVKMVPAVPTGRFPSTWPTDGRAGGVPDPDMVGPAMIQIGNESGFLPEAVELPNHPVGYDYNRRTITVLNVSNTTLFLGPAERADVIIDFSGVPAGSRLILYNDAPAPVPAFDPRIDYYTGNEDLTSIGGAPTTLPGFGPNTRTIMQFRVEGSASARFDRAALAKAVPKAFAASQIPLIVALGRYVGIHDTQVTITPPGSSVPITLPILRKAIHELFELEYGRMNAILGTELKLTNFTTQTTIPLGYIDPPTEMIQNGETQIWKITHNGVDTHAIHFHFFDVQLINRVGWDGQIKPPDANEIGWKETVRMNPLEDVIVAVRPTAPDLPFGLPDSIRLNDITNPEGSHKGFTHVDPYTGVPDIVRNRMMNYGWEYVWHCHLLGHEENDMMRPIVFTVPPGAPLAARARIDGTRAEITFDPPLGTGGTPILYYTVTARPGGLSATSGSSPIVLTGLTPGRDYKFTVTATNEVGTSPVAAQVKVVSRTDPPPEPAPSRTAASRGQRSPR